MKEKEKERERLEGVAMFFAQKLSQSNREEVKTQTAIQCICKCACVCTAFLDSYPMQSLLYTPSSEMVDALV